MADYKTGTVAKATVLGVPDVTVIRLEGRWVSGVRIGATCVHHRDHVADVRPLVVLDLSESDTLALIADLRRTVGTGLACAIADQIEAQIRPAIEESTGLGAVVEDDKGNSWVRATLSEYGWISKSAGKFWADWDSINPVRILSEGVQP